MDDPALHAWATYEHRFSQPLEERLYDGLITVLVELSVRLRVKPVRSVILDVCSGYGTPQLHETLEDYCYHGIEPDAQLVRRCQALRVNGAVFEHASLEAVLQATLREPVVMVMGAVPEYELASDLFLDLPGYNAGHRSSRLAFAQWVQQQVAKGKAVLGAAIFPVGERLPLTLVPDREIIAERQGAFLWEARRAPALTLASKAPLAWSPWAWAQATPWLGHTHLKRRGDRWEPRFATYDAQLKAMTHIANYGHFDTWHQKLQEVLGALTRRNLARFGTVAGLNAAVASLLGTILPLESLTHFGKLVRTREALLTPYPDNGDQACRYWLLKQGDPVYGPDGVYAVASYQPSAQEGTPPTVILEKQA